MSQQPHSVLGAIQRFWQRSYAADYLGLTILVIGFALVQFFVTPFHRLFSLSDLAISFPYAEVERVSVTLLFVYAGAIPLAIFVAYLIISKAPSHKTHVTLLGFAISLILTAFLTDVFKNAVGRPRPDLLARCLPKEGTEKVKLVNYEVCTQEDHHTLHDGWRSFPSGHSSFAFSGLGYLALFLAGQMHIFRPRVDLARTLIALTPLVGAALIAISRCEDYRHDVYDITIGSILGLLVANFVYRAYYPALRSSHCDAPYLSRAELTDSKRHGKLRDEETGRRVRGVGGAEERLPLRDRSSERE